MLVSEERLPVLNNVFRRMNNRVSAISALSVEASLRNVRMIETPIKGSLDIDITEKRTGKGAPMAPFTLYVNNAEEFTGRCDTRGKHTHEIYFKNHRSVVDVYHARKRLLEASDSLSVLWDNFNDNEVDRKLWATISGKSIYPGTPKAYERNKRIVFDCAATRSIAGIHTVKPVDISNGRIKANLYSGGIVTCFISILPSTDPFQGASYNTGYDIGIWEDGGTKLFVYSGSETVYRQRTLKANPEIIEIVIDGDIIRFLEGGSEVYAETYKPPSKLCNIYLWAHHWWYQGSGSSWADDFLFVGG